MATLDHGIWEIYIPATPPEGFPLEAAFSHRVQDNVDWYQFSQDANNFSGGIVITAWARDAGGPLIVGAATYDRTAIFPGNHLLLEVTDVQTSDPQGLYGNKVYDPATGDFSDPPASSTMDTATSTLLKRIEVLEAKLGGA